LGELRFEQQASVHQLLREYTILASVLEEFIAAESQQLEVQPPLESVLRTIQRINHDVRSIMQTTVDTFVHRYTAKIADQHERLQSFNRLISHELRKPIQAILSNAELLCLDEQTGATMRSRAVIIRQEVQNLSRSLRNLEQITVVGEATPDNLTLQEVDLQSIVKDIFNQAREDAESRAVDLRMGPLPDTLKVETSKLDLVLRNLIDNGIKYSDPRKNERFIEIYQLSEDADSEHVTLCVRDNGIGIPADKLNEIFTRFGRAHANADDVLNVTGYGIGLSVVKEELNRMNGTIEVESEVDKGTRFLIRLPRQTDTTRIILPGSDTDQ
jgi:signal transduction histidine kinase